LPANQSLGRALHGAERRHIRRLRLNWRTTSVPSGSRVTDGGAAQSSAQRASQYVIQRTFSRVCHSGEGYGPAALGARIRGAGVACSGNGICSGRRHIWPPVETGINRWPPPGAVVWSRLTPRRHRRICHRAFKGSLRGQSAAPPPAAINCRLDPRSQAECLWFAKLESCGAKRARTDPAVRDGGSGRVPKESPWVGNATAHQFPAPAGASYVFTAC
jgi:hypothetical protein